MKVGELVGRLPLRVVHLDNPDREIDGVYAGDLLSWVMGRAKPGQLWLTIMTNANVAAVASLIDLSAVIVCEGCEPEAALVSACRTRDINLLVSPLSVYQTCTSLGILLP